MRPWQSLRRKLPLLISTLLGLVVSAVSWSAYHQVEDVLVQATGSRLTGVTQQLAVMLEEAARRVRHEVRTVAADPALLTLLTRPSAATAREARAALARTSAASQPASYALWTRHGERLLADGPLVPAGDGDPGLAARPGVAPPAVTSVGPLVRAGGGLAYRVTMPVIDGAHDTLGVLVVYRRVSNQSADRVAGLIGAPATLLLGNADGDVWTDLSTEVAGPPRPFPVGSPTEYAAADGRREMGVAIPIRTTPWLVMVHSPRDAALAPARQFVVRIAGIALVLVAIGAAVAWILSHRVTAPLIEVSRAAADVARGDYARRVTVARRDELGSLATSFNAMAEQVGATSRELQGYARELEAANAGLRASEERYRRLVEAAHEGICAVDPVGTVVYANARVAQMLGHEPDELLGRSLFDFMDPDAAFNARTRFARQQRGIAEAREVPFRRKDGTTLWTNKSVSSLFDGSGTFNGALFVLSDVTERHEAQERLARSERHFRALTENASDMIAVLDGRGVVRYASPALERFVGQRDAAIVGTPAVARVHQEDAAAVEAALAQVIADPTRPVRLQYRYRHETDGWRDLFSVATNLLADPAVEGIVVNSRDVTDERALESQLRQAQKMEAVGQLAAGVAHDFNNLLSVMTSYTGILLADLPADDPNRADVEEIRRASERAAGLTRQLLAFSRQQVLQSRVLDLNAVVRDMEKMLGCVLREDVRLETALAPRLGHVRADPGQLEQVLMNLAVNARDAMPDGGALTITTANAELDAEYARLHPEATPGRYVMVAVSDTGVGMDAVTQARAFEPFFTTKAVGKGTGLGLSTVYGIVRQSGGHVAVFSEPGTGTTVRVYLPQDATTPAARARGGSSPALHRGSGTVLLVEDEAVVRAAARRILERAGYAVLEAPNGPAALRLCAGSGAPAPSIDLLLTDMVMPEMSGRELAVRIRELRPEVVIAFMSGYTEDAVLRQGVLAPDAVFIQKPFTPHTLTEALRTALEGALTGSAA